MINEILHSININIASDSSEYSSGGNYCQNNGLLGQSSLPPAPMAEAGTESVFYCAEGCFVLDQGRIFAEIKLKKVNLLSVSGLKLTIFKLLSALTLLFLTIIRQIFA